MHRIKKSEISIIRSTKGKDMLNINNYLFYQRNTRANGDIYWKCRNETKSSCPASLTTIGLSSEIKSSNFNHVGHFAESEIDLIFKKRIDNCKQRAQKEQLPLQQIYRQEMVAALTDHKQPELVARNVPKFANKKNGFIASRRKDIPKLPQKLPEIKIDEDRYRLTSYNRRFLLFDTNDEDRIIAHVSCTQLEIFSKASRWHLDGTFKSAPTLFYQNYAIHG